MSFLYPVFLVGALAAAIPIVLHLLRRDVAPDVPFTAVRLLQKSPIERSRRRRLRDLLLLAARVAALVLLAAAFARPYTASPAAAGALRIVAIDRSYSMGAPDRFPRALDMARAAIGEAGFTERVAVIAFDERADVIAPPGGPGDARASLAGLTAGNGATRYAPVFEKAAELAAGSAARLVIISDLQRAGWDGDRRARAAASLTVDVRSAGETAVNVAVTDVRTEGGVVAASLRNASTSARQGTLVFAHDAAVFGRVPFSIPPESSIEVQRRWNVPPSGSVTVTIDDAEGFPADNARHHILKASTAPAALVVQSGEASGFFVLRALEAAGGPIEPRAVTGADIAGGRARDVGRQAAVLLLSTRNLDRAARDAIVGFVRGGGGLFIAAAPEVEPDVLSAMFGWNQSSFAIDETPRQVTIAAADMRHPVFRPFSGLTANLGQVTVQRAWRVRPDSWDVPARFSDGSPALLDRAEGAGRVVLFASDVDRRWNDFPLHVSFVPFVVETVRYLATRRAVSQEVLVSQVPAGVQPAPGVHKLADGRAVAVNVDTRESGTAVVSPDEFKAMIDTTPDAARPAAGAYKAEQNESRQSLWQYGLMLMLLVLVAESFVGKV